MSQRSRICLLISGSLASIFMLFQATINMSINYSLELVVYGHVLCSLHQLDIGMGMRILQLCRWKTIHRCTIFPLAPHRYIRRIYCEQIYDQIKYQMHSIELKVCRFDKSINHNLLVALIRNSITGICFETLSTEILCLHLLTLLRLSQTCNFGIHFQIRFRMLDNKMVKLKNW